MKTMKFLAAMAIPALFAACTNEDFSAEEGIVQQKEVVGTELVGTDISINFGNHLASRQYVEGGQVVWADDDKLGLGWVTYGNPSQDDQEKIDDYSSISSTLNANHLFFKDENGIFTTKGNVYKGYHFAYFPYQYQEKIGQLVVDVNPAMEKEYSEDVYNKSLQISAINHLSKDNLDLETNTLNNNTPYDLFRAVNELYVQLNPDGKFASVEALKNLTVKEVSLKTPKAIFNTQAKINPQYLPENQFEKVGDDMVYSTELTKAAVRKALYNSDNSKGAVSRAGSTDNLTTVVKSGIIVGEQQAVRMFTLPCQSYQTFEKNEVVFEIKVPGGHFVIDYEPEAEEGSIDYKNNKTIENVIAAASSKGYTAGSGKNYKFSKLFDGAFGLALYLDETMFVADYEITNETDWAESVALADALGETNPTFKLCKTYGNAGNNGLIKFTKQMDLPEDCEVLKVVAENNDCNIVIDGNIDWLSEIKPQDKVEVIVNAGRTLTVAGLLDAEKIVNNGTVEAGANASISTNESATLENNSRVVIEYGAYVYPTSGKEGTIAFRVKDAKPETISKINTLLSNTTIKKEYANINTLIVETELDLNESASTLEGSDDRYNGVADVNKYLVDLAKVAIELNGGSLVHYLSGANTTVKNVIAVGGKNTIDDIVVAENIETEGGATLNVNNTVITTIAKPYFAEKIINNGTLNSNVASLNVKVVDNQEGTLKVATGRYIYYTDEYIQGGTSKGWILRAAASSNPENATEIDLVVDDNKYTVNTALGLLALTTKNLTANDIEITLGNDIDMSGINWSGLELWNSEKPASFDGNGKTIKNLTGSNGLIKSGCINVKNLTVDGAVIFGTTSFVAAVGGTVYGNFENVTVKNSQIEASTAGSAKIRYGAIVGLHNSGNATNCTVENTSVKAYHNVGGISGTVNETNDRKYTNCSVKDCTISSSINHNYIGAVTGNANGVSLTLDNCKAINTIPSKLYGNGAVTIK